MRSQFEKNKETLMEEIEKLCDRPMNDAVAARLNTYQGALKALCWAEKEWEEDKPAVVETYTAETRADEKPARTPELDGDTEFEQVIMMIPVDVAHMTAICNIFADHMEQLAIVNRRAYDTIMLRLKEVARN